MDKTKIFLIVAAVLLTLVGGGVFLASVNKQAEPEEQTLGTEVKEEPVILEIFTPKVLIQTPDSSEFVEATHGQEVPVGSKIKTDEKGRAQLIYPTHTVTRLDHSTEIILEEFNKSPQKTSVGLSVGRIWSRVSKLLGGDSYDSESSTLVASVRGTSYGHEILKDGFNKLIASKRQVDGNCTNDTDKGTITQGNKATFDCNTKTKLIIEKLTNKDLQDEWYKFNLEEDKKLNERFGGDTYDDEEAVLGAGIEALASVLGLTVPTPDPIIDCTGPDGKVFGATQADCDNLNNFWASHPPAPDAGGNPPAVSPPGDTSAPSITQETALLFNDIKSGGICTISFSADVSDSSGVSSASAIWSVFDIVSENPADPIANGSTVLSGPSSGLWTGSDSSIYIPAYGELEWYIQATDSSSNKAATTLQRLSVGPDICNQPR